MESSVSFEGTAGLLRGSVFAPERYRHAVVLLHGFGGYRFSSKKRAWMAALEKAGYLVLAFDFFGHGQSAGNPSDLTITQTLSDTQSALRYLRAHYAFEKVALVGHSMGGVNAYLTASRHDGISAISVVASPVHFPNYPDVLCDPAAVASWKHSDALPISTPLSDKPFSLKYAFKKDQLSYDYADALRHLRAPVLFLHGTADAIVPASESQQAYALAPQPKSLELIEGGSHSLSESQPVAIPKLLAFLQDFL